jgi:hypothetical protein
MVDDGRYRQKVFLDTYVDDANLTLDGGSEATWISHYADPEYSIEQVFGSSGLNVDLAIAIGDPRTTPHLNYLHVPYKYEEVTPLTLAAKNKSGLTAVKLLWKAEQELREIAEANGGYLRHIRSTRPSRLDLGSYLLHQVEVELAYVRSSEVTPTTPLVIVSAANFIFPNITNISLNGESVDANILLPSRLSSYTQALGDNDLEITLTCDMSSSPTSLTWLRPQATTPKTDKVPYQFILDLRQALADGTASTTLNMGWGSTLSVRMASHNINGDILTVTFREYRTSSATSLTSKARWGIT